MRMRINAPMTAIRHIRKHVLGISQAALAAVAGTTQATVSRWERGELSPSLDELEAIRSEAAARNIEWRDAWFFEPPPPTPSTKEEGARP